MIERDKKNFQGIQEEEEEEEDKKEEEEENWLMV